MSARSKWKEGYSSAKDNLKEDDTISMTIEMNKMSFEPVRENADRSMSLDKKGHLVENKNCS